MRRPDIDETIRWLSAWAEAGADCQFAPQIDSVEQVTAIIAAVSPKPVNLLINDPFMTVVEAGALGVRRVRVGGTLARTAWAGFLQAAQEIADRATFLELRAVAERRRAPPRTPGTTAHGGFTLGAMRPMPDVPLEPQ